MRKRGKRLPIRETFTYPKVTVTSEYNPCHDNISPYEHVLDCGHLITTAEPDEPCAPNCHPATETSGPSKPKMSLSRALEKDFYCDACVEEQAERIIYKGESCKNAEKTRVNYRRHEARTRDKANSFRKCYIAQKTGSVPCDKDGVTVKDYDPYVSTHPFDGSWPPTGDNMYEDIDAPITEPQPDEEEPQIEGQNSADGSTTYIDEAVTEDVNETITEGARWLREEEEREHRREEKAKIAIQRVRAAARPVVLISSPTVGLCDVVLRNRSVSTTQTNTTDESPASVSTQEKRRRKRKNVASEESTPASSVQPSKRKKLTPKTPRREERTPNTPSPDSENPSSTLDSPIGRTKQTESTPDSHAGAAKKVRKNGRKTAADNEAATEPVVQPAKRAKVTPETSSPVQAAAAASGKKRKRTGDSGLVTKSTKKPSQRGCTVI